MVWWLWCHEKVNKSSVTQSGVKWLTKVFHAVGNGRGVFMVSPIGIEMMRGWDIE